MAMQRVHRERRPARARRPGRSVRLPPVGRPGRRRSRTGTPCDSTVPVVRPGRRSRSSSVGKRRSVGRSRSRTTPSRAVEHRVGRHAGPVRPHPGHHHHVVRDGLHHRQRPGRREPGPVGPQRVQPRHEQRRDLVGPGAVDDEHVDPQPAGGRAADAPRAPTTATTAAPPAASGRNRRRSSGSRRAHASRPGARLGDPRRPGRHPEGRRADRGRAAGSVRSMSDEPVHLRAAAGSPRAPRSRASRSPGTSCAGCSP